jgi:sugar phosphate isomerase/epimerase
MPPPRPAASALIDLSHRPLLLACGDQSGDEALTRIAENGFEQVYVGRDSLGFRIGATDVTAAQLGEASADAERKGLGLHATLIGGSLGDDDGGVADYHRILTHCEALGMRWVLDFGPPTPEDHKGYISLMKAVAPRAAELGLGISMKPHGTCLSNADLLQVVQEVQHPAFGIALDPGNVVYYTEGAEDPVPT